MSLPTPIYYMASPYTSFAAGIDAAHNEACKLAAHLIRRGYCIYSPIAATHCIARIGGLDALDQKMWMQFDEAMMDRCDALIVGLLEGWDQSDGLAHEIKVFEQARKPIWDCDPVSLEITRRQYEVAFS